MVIVSSLMIVDLQIILWSYTLIVLEITSLLMSDCQCKMTPFCYVTRVTKSTKPKIIGINSSKDMFFNISESHHEQNQRN
jgi:hypothetical protein